MTPAFLRQLFIYEYILQTYKKRLSHPNQDILEEKDYKYDNIIRFLERFASPFSVFSGFSFFCAFAGRVPLIRHLQEQHNKHTQAAPYRYF
jgi:hypothetical protein